MLAGVTEQTASRIRGGIFVAALLLVWISTSPFRATGAGETEMTGNVVNQLTFLAMGGVALGALALVDVRVLKAYANPLYALMLGWLTITMLLSANFDVSLRAYLFTMVVIVIAGCIMVLPQTEQDFAELLGGASLAVVVVCYAGLVLYPDIAIHTSGDIREPEHAGSWRGLFDHKNITGAMMAIFLMIGLYVAQARSVWTGYTLAVLAAIFLFFTKSKTAMALGPVVFGLTFLAARVGSGWLRGLLVILPLVIIMALTFGTVMSPELKGILDVVSPGQTFTGRIELWDFALDLLGERPITGFGLEGFWGSDRVRFAEGRSDDVGFAQGMMHAHNGYVDAAITMGIPGFVLVILTFVLLPFRDWVMVRHTPSNDRMALLFARIWLLALYSACLESFFFRRADPVWFAMLLAVLGLRLLATWRVRPE